MKTDTDYSLLKRSAIDDVVAAFPVHYAILHNESHIFIGYYNSEHQLIVAQREKDGVTWTRHALPVQVGWDSHNYITMCFDHDGHLHLSANMHVVPLVYFISDRPHDITSWTQQDSLIGSQEDRCTYPAFLNTKEGDLVFHYRDGSSGDGCEVYNLFSASDRRWQRLLDQPLLDGNGQMNAYPHGPVPGPDNNYHLCWVWRDNPAADSNHDLSYAYSPDLKHWFAGDGSALTLPIRIEQTKSIVDPIGPKTGMINGNTCIGFDANEQPFIVYHKFDAAGMSQAYIARCVAGIWQHACISQWNYRWAFEGGGSIEFEILIHNPIYKDGSLLIPYYHVDYGSGVLQLDANSLELIEDKRNYHLYPQEIYTVESDVKGMRLNQSGGYPSPYILQWESMPNNRDQQPDDSALSSQLYLCEFTNT
ncbi:MAG: BNR-4 repeat-containing protein [Planctomycetes bacterium]|nr:BNR-4 repeat-containing protein [Planctomycetota bacterium]